MKPARWRVGGIDISILGDRLRAERLLLRMTLDMVSEKLNLSRTAIHNHETDTCEPDLATLLKYGQLYDVSVAYLLGETDKRKVCYEGIDAEIALRIEGIAYRLTPKVRGNLLKCLDWIERDLRDEELSSWS